ncbi:MAG: DEAD/DEAH box helicase [Streptosporangiales bacterium]
MNTPAERYTAAQRRAAESSTELGRFADLYDFRLDEYQVGACRALEGGTGVLVAAPTGAGKTVVGEFAIHLALATGNKCFYTTPIKALSNQKYADLVARYGSARVGLLTGDNSVNGDAPVVVMTTEVLRNMLYAGSAALRGLGYVVMDEVHYLADRFRGAVWEECIIHLPESVRLIALSATVSNAEEFGEWLQEVRGDTDVVVEEHRPVPLWQHVLAGNRLHDLFVQETGNGSRRKVNPELVRLARDDGRRSRYDRGRGRNRGYQRGRGHTRFRPPSRMQVVERLDREGLLPAIYFIFSRAGCDAAVRSCLFGSLSLNTPEEAEKVRAYAEQECLVLPDEDLAVLGYDEWLEGLSRGFAAHHAGLLPTFKEVTETLFAAGLIKAVFATETLALGINMPARSVVLEQLTKWNGETHANITPGEYTQLTGRAGRRGIDVEGHGVVLFSPELDPEALGGLASTRTYPLKSSFRPSYNMAVNLVRQVGRDRARGMLEESFAQFQADRAVVGLARKLARNEEGLRGYHEAMRCDLGDFEEYARMRRELSDLEARQAKESSARQRAAAARSLEELHRGDVVVVPAGRRSGLAVVLDPGLGRDEPRPLVLTSGRQVKRLSLVDFPVPVEPLDRLRVPKSFNARSPQDRRDLASTLRAKGYDEREARRDARRRDQSPEDPRIDQLRTELRRHPCHDCPDREEHARWAERYFRLQRDTEGLRRRIEGRTNLIARTFDRVCGVLEQLGYLDGDTVNAAGERLARLYAEMDLLASECLRQGLWDGLRPAELAACVSTLVFEARQSDDTRAPRLPSGGVRQTLGEMVRLWGELEEVESEHGVSFQREPDLGFCWGAYRWANGARLDTVLDETDLAPGDFVRWSKQVIDLLGQVADATEAEGHPVHRVARSAIDAMRRGVVAYTSVG